MKLLNRKANDVIGLVLVSGTLKLPLLSIQNDQRAGFPGTTFNKLF
jgi:hypothetical protein